MMLEYLLLLFLLRYREAIMPRVAANDDDNDERGLLPYAGIHYEGEQEYIRRVK